MGILEGAIIGAIVGGATVIIQSTAKTNRYKSILKTITEPVDYSGMYHYASYKRYKKSFKYYDSYGILYLAGKMLYYKDSKTATPLSFDLSECTVQQEDDWRMLKWFSVTTPVGEKFYFNSSKMGAIKNNSDETLNGLAILKARSAKAS